MCFNGATCVVNVNDATRRFTCQCASGYYGNQCQIKTPKTCLDYLSEHVKPISGKYTIIDAKGTTYEVFCDFDSEESMAWTLFASFDTTNLKIMSEKPFYRDRPSHQYSPNWINYRLRKSAMTEISSHSTFWRATCSYSQYGVDFRDYVRVRLSIVNPLTYHTIFQCLPVDYLDIKGINCAYCTHIFFQRQGTMLRLETLISCFKQFNFDTSMVKYQCENGNYAAAFGWRLGGCLDPKHRCTEKSTSTTEFWFGAVRAQ